MTKGDGWMMAVASMKPRQKTIPCPLCGERVSWEELATWFKSEKCPLSKPHCQQCQFFADPESGGPAIHAMAINGEGIVIATAHFVRYANGCTDLMVHLENKATVETVVEFFENGGEWLLAPRLEEESNDK